VSNILFFDTETTGLHNPNLPPADPEQPYLVQLAAQLCSSAGAVISEFSVIVRQNVEIPESAAKVHGITTERAHLYGINVRSALSLFVHFYSRARLLVAHNIAFDINILETELARYNGQPRPISKERFCTMNAAAPIVNLPPTARMLAAGFNKPKAPKLEECIQYFFGEKLEGAHDAMNDVRACARVYFHLQSLAKAA
jgi:DNA polymerase-3 subunit epsilon